MQEMLSVGFSRASGYRWEQRYTRPIVMVTTAIIVALLSSAQAEKVRAEEAIEELEGESILA